MVDWELFQINMLDISNRIMFYAAASNNTPMSLGGTTLGRSVYNYSVSKPRLWINSEHSKQEWWVYL